MAAHAVWVRVVKVRFLVLRPEVPSRCGWNGRHDRPKPGCLDEACRFNSCQRHYERSSVSRTPSRRRSPRCDSWPRYKADVAGMVDAAGLDPVGLITRGGSNPLIRTLHSGSPAGPGRVSKACLCWVRFLAPVPSPDRYVRRSGYEPQLEGAIPSRGTRLHSVEVCTRGCQP